MMNFRIALTGDFTFLTVIFIDDLGKKIVTFSRIFHPSLFGNSTDYAYVQLSLQLPPLFLFVYKCLNLMPVKC